MVDSIYLRYVFLKLLFSSPDSAIFSPGSRLSLSVYVDCCVENDATNSQILWQTAKYLVKNYFFCGCTATESLFTRRYRVIAKLSTRTRSLYKAVRVPGAVLCVPSARLTRLPVAREPKVSSVQTTNIHKLC